MMEVGRDFERMRDYTLGRMTEEERHTFEDRLARDSELVHELERSLRLQEGLRVLRARGYFAQQRTARAHGGLRTRARAWNLLVPALAAAGIAALGLFLWVPPRLPPVLQTAAHSPVAARFTFIAMRSGSASDLTLPTAGAIELNVRPAAHATVSSFRVRLVSDDRRDTTPAVGELAGLATDADGYLRCYVDAARLSAGRYRLLVEPDTGAGTAPESFAFTLRGTGTTAR